ncbi:hypothetical protein F6X40_11235 [Paraburkholderia sp. UCT31]|uniref:hypothetical protein n=1 Tax=Paraburkholderia sp. UCT31 TaxID=2615209 RepID=UPI001655A877|nr:hypothetical protein [Paraburkholderia sp. UCT31]MBC8737377.1 hypothetical protein [Paraburkholderia sp. UCT31]
MENAMSGFQITELVRLNADFQSHPGHVVPKGTHATVLSDEQYGLIEVDFALPELGGLDAFVPARFFERFNAFA